MRKKKDILIMKVGALGDVLRTTPILHKFEGNNVTWLTSEKARPLLKGNPLISRVLTLESPNPDFYDSHYEIALNMDEDKNCCSLSSLMLALGIVKPNNFYGYFFSNGVINYKGRNKRWFDMGLSSKLGREKANEIKLHNAKSYEELLFSILGYKFNGEEYILNYKAETEEKLVGIQNPAERDSKWPMKRWNQYEKLEEELAKKGFRAKKLELHDKLEDHIRDVASCQYVICEDSLPMQIAIALKKPTVAIFTCTSPMEIYGYGLVRKVVSLKLAKYFYRRDFDPDAASTIKLEIVLEAFNDAVHNNNSLQRAWY